MKKYVLNFSLIIAIIFTFSSCGPGAVVVKTRPQPPVYVRPVAPGPSHVWVDGDWVWRGNQYVYKQGYWATPRYRNAVYIPGHWQATRRGEHWVPGHWK